MVDAMSARSMVEMGCAATTLGSWDLFRGPEHLKNVLAQAGLTMVSANVYDESTGERFVQPYVVVSRAGKRFGITGLIDPEADIRVHRDVEKLGVRIEDPIESLKAILPELREKSDLVILLSQLTLDQAKLLAEEVTGVDFILVGSNPRHAAQAYEFGNSVFIQPGYKGQRMSDFRLRFDAEGSYAGYSGQTFDLGDKVPSDAAMALKLKEHKIAIEEARKQRSAAARQARTTAAPAYVEECLGVEASCVRCHQSEYDQWKDTPHASAYSTLERSHQATNPECLRCHTTCYFDMPLDGSVAVKEELRNVQCESCHGKGTDHARDGSYGAITEATCAGCHDEENSPDFDFAKYLELVSH